MFCFHFQGRLWDGEGEEGVDAVVDVVVAVELHVDNFFPWHQSSVIVDYLC